MKCGKLFVVGMMLTALVTTVGGRASRRRKAALAALAAAIGLLVFSSAANAFCCRLIDEDPPQEFSYYFAYPCSQGGICYGWVSGTRTKKPVLVLACLVADCDEERACCEGEGLIPHCNRAGGGSCECFPDPDCPCPYEACLVMCAWALTIHCNTGC
jgi:hypothetical protein